MSKKRKSGRLRKVLRSRSFIRLGFLGDWRLAGLSIHMKNREIRAFLKKVRKKVRKKR